MARQRNVLRLTLVLGLTILLSACHYRAPGTYYYGGYYGQGYGHQGHGHNRSHHGYSW